MTIISRLVTSDRSIRRGIFVSSYTIVEGKKSVMLKRRGQFFEKSSFDFANLFGFEEFS